MYSLTRTYVQNTPSSHQVASLSSPFILSFLTKQIVCQIVKNDRASPHSPFSHMTGSFHICLRRCHTMLPLSTYEGRVKGEWRRMKRSDRMSFHHLPSAMSHHAASVHLWREGERRMKGPDGVSFHSRNAHKQGVSATNERRKGKVESHQYYDLFERATRQKMLFRTIPDRKTMVMRWFRQRRLLSRKQKGLGIQMTPVVMSYMIISDWRNTTRNIRWFDIPCSTHPAWQVERTPHHRY